MDIMERVHRFMKQEEVASDKIKSDQGGIKYVNKDNRAPYPKPLAKRSRYDNTRTQRQGRFPQQGQSYFSFINGGRNKVEKVMESKKNGIGRKLTG